jgi:hypothetical protein
MGNNSSSSSKTTSIIDQKYALKTDLTGYALNSDLKGYLNKDSVLDKGQLNVYETKSDLANYAPLSSLSNYALSSDLAKYAKTSDYLTTARYNSTRDNLVSFVDKNYILEYFNINTISNASAWNISIPSNTTTNLVDTNNYWDQTTITKSMPVNNPGKSVASNITYLGNGRVQLAPGIYAINYIVGFNDLSTTDTTKIRSTWLTTTDPSNPIVGYNQINASYGEVTSVANSVILTISNNTTIYVSVSQNSSAPIHMFTHGFSFRITKIRS